MIMRSVPFFHRRVSAAVIIVAVVTMVIAVSGCGRADPTPASAGTQTVKVGLLVSLSGTYKTVGEDMQKGWNLYLSTHGGKLGGRTAQVIVGDEAAGGDTAGKAARKMVESDKVQAIVGVVAADSVRAVMNTTVEAKVPLIGTNARLGNQKPEETAWVWHTSYISTEPGLAMGEYVHQQVKDGTVWAIGPDYAGGHDEVGGFVTAYTRAGGKLTNPGGQPTWTPWTPPTTNFAPYLAQIKAAKPAAVYTFYAGGSAIAFVKQYKEFGLTMPLYAAGFLTEGTVLGAEGPAALGVKNSLNYSADLENPTNRVFAAEYLRSYGTAPTTFSMSTYDGAAVLDKAIAAIPADRPVTAEAINAALAGLGQVDSPRGTWQWNATTHAPVQRWYLREVRPDGRANANVVIQELLTLGG
jgi:branched-chain amino acid transport system substrate-binding protein